MKIKKLFGGLLLAATIMSASSCEEMFDQMVNVQKVCWTFNSTAVKYISETATSMEFQTIKAGISSITANLGAYITGIGLYAHEL